MNTNKIYANGEIVSGKKATVSLMDRGFLYGDGVFETIRTYNGVPFKLEEHIARLWESAKGISLNLTYSPEEVIAKVNETLEANGFKESYIRVVLTRGIADRFGLGTSVCQGNAELFVMVDDLENYFKTDYSKGCKVITYQEQGERKLGGIKSLNYLNNILIKIEAEKENAIEAILINNNHLVLEGTTSNVFILKHGVLKTPPPRQGIIKGITRDIVLQIARDNKMKTSEEVFTVGDLYNASEAFLTFTTGGIIPINTVDDQTLGLGKPGDVTKELTKLFEQYVKKDLKK